LPDVRVVDAAAVHELEGRVTLAVPRIHGRLNRGNGGVRGYVGVLRIDVDHGGRRHPLSDDRVGEGPMLREDEYSEGRNREKTREATAHRPAPAARRTSAKV